MPRISKAAILQKKLDVILNEINDFNKHVAGKEKTYARLQAQKTIQRIESMVGGKSFSGDIRRDK